MTIVFVTIEEKVVTWRSGWPVKELKRRGYDAQLWATAAGIPRPKAPADGSTYMFHIINRAWNVEGRILTFMDLAREAREFGRLIVSVDDDWTQMLHIQQGEIDPLAREVHRQIPELIRQADKVVVATPRLAEVYGKWAREVHIVPNVLPEWVLRLPRPPPENRVMWMGEMYVHGMDWKLLEPYARDLPPLRLVGSGKAAAEMIRGWGARDVEYTEAIFDQRKLYREIGRGVVAIIPLADTGFNRGKSWSKPMEFMARGVQPLASTHAEYKRLDELTGALPTYEEPAELVEAVNAAWENRTDGDDLPDRLREADLTMETGGGDAWEKALA